MVGWVVDDILVVWWCNMIEDWSRCLLVLFVNLKKCLLLFFYILKLSIKEFYFLCVIIK